MFTLRRDSDLSHFKNIRGLTKVVFCEPKHIYAFDLDVPCLKKLLCVVFEQFVSRAQATTSRD